MPTDASPADPASPPGRRLIPKVKTATTVAAALVLCWSLLFFLKTPMAWRWPLRLGSMVSALWLAYTATRALLAMKLTPRKALFVLIVAGFYYLVLAIVCQVFLTKMGTRDDRLAKRGLTRLPPECRDGIQAALDEKLLNQFDPKIGWVPRPDYDAPSYAVSAQGLRGKRTYAQTPADPGKRVLCLGDSFTFGVSVRDENSYPAQAEQLLPGTEWLNFGIPGSCLVQSYMRYLRDARDFGGKHVVIGFMTNDAQRTVNVFRPFLNLDSGCPFTKPMAKFQNGRFSIEPNPYTDISQLRRLLEDDANELKNLMSLDYLTWGQRGFGAGGPIGRTLFYFWDVFHVEQNVDALLPRRLPLSHFIKNLLPRDPYGPDIWNPKSAGFAAVCGMFDEYYRTVIADGRNPLFVILPGPHDVEDFSEHYPRLYLPLLNYLKERNYPVFDFLDPLTARHKADLSRDAIFTNLHYLPEVNRELAEEIIKALRLQ